GALVPVLVSVVSVGGVAGATELSAFMVVAVGIGSTETSSRVISDATRAVGVISCAAIAITAPPTHIAAISIVPGLNCGFDFFELARDVAGFFAVADAF